MRYEPIPELTRSEILEWFQSGQREQVTRALLSAALYDEDYEWVQEQCLRYLVGPELDLRCTAVVALGHLVRLHGRIDRIALDHLELAEREPSLQGYASDVRDDIECFITRKQTD